MPSDKIAICTLTQITPQPLGASTLYLANHEAVRIYAPIRIGSF